MKIKSDYYSTIINKLNSLNKKDYLVNTAESFIQLIIIVLSVLFFYSFLENTFHFNSDTRTILVLFFLTFILILFIKQTLIPLLKCFSILKGRSYEKTAEIVGRHFPGIKDELLNALQIKNAEADKIFSKDLIDAAFKRIFLLTEKINFNIIISYSKLKRELIYLFSLAVFLSILFFAFPSLHSSLYRVLNFDEEFVNPPEFTIKLHPGNVTITKGQALVITMEISGKLPEEIFIATKDISQTDFKYSNIVPDANRQMEFKINSVREELKYFVKAENYQSEIFTVNVVDYPIVKSFTLRVVPPLYSKLPVFISKDDGNISALKGSKVNVNLLSNNGLKTAKIIFSDSSHINLAVNKQEAAGKFAVKNNGFYKFELTDLNGNRNQAPIIYNIQMLPDENPTIELLAPVKDVLLAEDNRLALSVNISDDYGLNKLLLNYKSVKPDLASEDDAFNRFGIPITKDKRQVVNYIWNLTGLNLSANDKVIFFLEVFDNDIISGPKSAKTNIITIRVPTLEELFAEADASHRNAEKDLQETLKEAIDLKEKMDRIDQKLKQDAKDLTWEEKQDIEKTLDQFEKLRQKAEQVAENVNKMKNELQKNNLLSEETLEKYLELQKMFEELSSEEMRKAMENMRNLLNELNRKNVQAELDNLKFNEEQFKESIKRTLNLLKRIQIEQKLDELSKRTEDILQKQEDIKKETEDNLSSDTGNTKEISAKQNKLSDELKQLKDKMKELAEKMADLEDMPKDEAKKIAEKLNSQNNEKLSEKASTKIKENQFTEALNNQNQISGNLKDFQNQLQELKKSVVKQNQIKTLAEMIKVLNNLVDISKMQEELKNKSEKNSVGQSNKENAQKQNELLMNLDRQMNRLSELSQKTFAITPEMGKSLGDARRQMQISIESLQNGQSSRATQSQINAMKSLNEAAILMQNSMQAMMQPGGQGGMMSLMQQLQKLSGQQLSLNNLTQMLKQGQNGKLSIQQQAQLQRIAQQQELIRKSLEQLNQEAKQSGKSKAIASNLEEILNRMQEVITDLHSENLDDNLVQKQERIFSKLLDAQRSVNERDFERTRESQSGKNILGNIPKKLNYDSKNSLNILRDELLKAFSEGYSKDYEQLIKKYFEMLQQESLEN